jgi:secreted PhoX family phosphatase
LSAKHSKDKEVESRGSNASPNETFQQVMRRHLSRRGLFKAGGLAASLAALNQLAPSGLVSSILEPETAHAAEARPISFTSIPLSTEDKVSVAAGYKSQVVIRWGDPLFPNVTGITPDIGGLNQTADLQAQRFGYNSDFLAYMPLPRGSKTANHGLLWNNHEYTNEEIMFPTYKGSSPDPALVDVALAAHGGSVVEIERDEDGNWSYIQDSTYNRRITAETPMEITGPAAGHDWLKTSADTTGTRVRGMLNNCGGGKTPWGTVLTAEENFNQYFGNLGGLSSSDPKRAVHQRFGIGTGASERGWEKVYSRFDIAKEPNEPFRYGWVVEIDPYDPNFMPKKRTALGRMKHEAANTALAKDGRAVAYTGDDERFEYAYKFVSSGKYDANSRSSNLRLLDRGTLYVAKFNDDGSGRWIPLTYGEGALTKANGWSSQADVLIRTRFAADAVGGTKMDRPEDFEPNAATGKIYLVMTNNSNRTAAQVDKANPRASNSHGHIIEITEAGNDPGSINFTWNIFMLAGNPGSGDGSFPGMDPNTVTSISSPDNIAFDSTGNLWIATDGQPSGLRMNDSIYGVPVDGDARGELRRLVNGPFGAEIASLEFTPDDETLFLSIQHPGEPGTGPNSANSRTFSPTSKWPDGVAPPRPAVIAITKTTPASPQIGT